MPDQPLQPPHHTQQQTTLVAKVADKKNVFEPWKDQPCDCVHCLRSFKNISSLHSHLGHCTYRFLNRYYKIGDYRRRNALQKLISDFHDPKMLLGAVAYLMNEGIIRNYAALPLEKSSKMLQYPDGRVLFNMVKKLLSEKELRALEAQVSTLNDEKDKFREAAGIKI
jgi:hypothetical protein